MSHCEQVPVTLGTGSAERGQFAALPADVLNRMDLSAHDKLVLATMNMESFSSGVCASSHAFISKKCGVSRTQVLKSQKILKRLNLIAEFGKPHAQVQAWSLLHPDMQALSGAVPVSVSDLRKRSSADRKLSACQLCGRLYKPRPNVDRCRKCRNDQHTKRVAQKAAREEVQVILGA